MMREPAAVMVVSVRRPDALTAGQVVRLPPQKEIEVPQIVVLPHPTLCPEGAVIDAPSGKSLCDALLESDVDIEHACEKSCACTTCHVLIREGFDTLPPAEEKEEDLLDRAWGLEASSRLSCQVILANDDLVIEIPKYTINQVSESH